MSAIKITSSRRKLIAIHDELIWVDYDDELYKDFKEEAVLTHSHRKDTITPNIQQVLKKEE